MRGQPVLQLHLPLPIPCTGRLPPRAEQERRWAELDARRPHARNLTPAEHIEFERLDGARAHRLARRFA